MGSVTNPLIPSSIHFHKCQHDWSLVARHSVKQTKKRGTLCASEMISQRRAPEEMQHFWNSATIQSVCCQQSGSTRGVDERAFKDKVTLDTDCEGIWNPLLVSCTHTHTHSQGNGLEDIGCHPSPLSLPVFLVKVSRGMTNAYSTVKQAK